MTRMYQRTNGYIGRNYLSKSFDNNLNDFDVTSSSSSNLDEYTDNSYVGFDNLSSQVRSLRTVSKSSGTLWSRDQNGIGNRRHSDGGLTDQDVSQVEAFFRSHKTSVFVCRSLANLYFSRGPNQWELARTGVPVLLLDKGETRARTQRLLQIVLAEKGTGFVLWKDFINGRTNYKAQDSTFHVMTVSWERGLTVGLRFDLMSAAMEFYEKVEQLVGDPRNLSLLSITTKKNKKPASSIKKKLEIVHLPRKCDISQPCCFEHVTNVAIDDKDRLYTLATLLSNKQKR